MSENSETPERKRERLRQAELKRNPSGNMNDALNRGGAGHLSDVAGSLGWKGIGIIILVIVIVFLLTSILF